MDIVNGIELPSTDGRTHYYAGWPITRLRLYATFRDAAKCRRRWERAGVAYQHVALVRCAGSLYIDDHPWSIFVSEKSELLWIAMIVNQSEPQQ